MNEHRKRIRAIAVFADKTERDRYVTTGAASEDAPDFRVRASWNDLTQREQEAMDAVRPQEPPRASAAPAQHDMRGIRMGTRIRTLGAFAKNLQSYKKAPEFCVTADGKIRTLSGDDPVRVYVTCVLGHAIPQQLTPIEAAEFMRQKMDVAIRTDIVQRIMAIADTRAFENLSDIDRLCLLGVRLAVQYGE